MNKVNKSDKEMTSTAPTSLDERLKIALNHYRCIIITLLK